MGVTFDNWTDILQSMYVFISLKAKKYCTQSWSCHRNFTAKNLNKDENMTRDIPQFRFQ